MAEAAAPADSSAITILIRDDCPTCAELLGGLRDFFGDLPTGLQTINLNTTEPPPYAQGVIVPATYIGGQLWRYGAYARQELAARLAAGQPPAGPEGATSP